MIKSFTNQEICLIAEDLEKIIQDNENKILFPFGINFLILKNKKLLSQLAREILEEREKIISQYAEINKEDNTAFIPKEEIENVNNIIRELFSIKQDINIQTIYLEDIEDIMLTPSQAEALMFMIEEEG